TWRRSHPTRWPRPAWPPRTARARRPAPPVRRPARPGGAAGSTEALGPHPHGPIDPIADGRTEGGREEGHLASVDGHHDVVSRRRRPVEADAAGSGREGAEPSPGPAGRLL